MYNCIFELKRLKISLVNDYNVMNVRYNSIKNNISCDTATVLCNDLENSLNRLNNEIKNIGNLISVLELLNKHNELSNRINSMESRLSGIADVTIKNNMSSEISSLKSKLNDIVRNISNSNLNVSSVTGGVDNIYNSTSSVVSNMSSSSVFRSTASSVNNSNAYDYSNVLSRVDLSKFNINNSNFNSNSNNSSNTFNLNLSNNTTVPNLNLNLNSNTSVNSSNNSFNDLVNKASNTWINEFRVNSYGLKEDSLFKYYNANDVDSLINSRSVNATNREKAVIANLTLIELGLNKNVTTKYELSSKNFNSVPRLYLTSNVINNGVDCASLASWSLNKSSGNFNNARVETIANLGTSTSYSNVKAGDIFAHDSHIMMVIDNNNSKGSVIVSDVSRKDNNYMSGARLQEVSYSNLKKLGFKARDLTSFYNS